MIDPTKLVLKQRNSLSEASFRKFEADIAQACRGSFIVDPEMRVPPLKQSSYVIGFRDALKSYRDNNWGSTMIPAAYETMRIKAKELKDGKVAITNIYEDKMQQGKYMIKDDDKSILLDENDKIVPRLGFQKKEPIAHEHRFMWPQDRNAIIALAKKMIAGTYDEFNMSHAFIVKIEDPDEVSEFMSLKDLFIKEDQSNPLDIEKLNRGWWRLSRW